MESDIIKISGEEDSLLQQQSIVDSVPSTDDGGVHNKTFFDCSPLQIPRSESIFSRSHSSSSYYSPIGDVTGSKDKENKSGNKVELPKLNPEPQSMKRKKKNTGFNLRKSMAWNKAFFSGEGVLNSEELSIVSGNISNSGEETLPVINENRRESVSGLDCCSDSPSLQSLEENLFKELPVSAQKEKKKNATLTPMASSGGRKVLSNNDVRSGSKRSGCPRPAASTSLKRPAHMNTLKAASKESKAFKLSVPKPEPSPLANNTSRTLKTASKESKAFKLSIPKPEPSPLANTARRAVTGTSKSKQNYPAQPATKVQKGIGFTGPLNNARSAQCDMKSCQPTKSSNTIEKSSVQQSRRNVASSLSGNHSTSNPQNIRASRANSMAKLNTEHLDVKPGHALKGKDSDFSNFSLSSSNNPCGQSTQAPRLQTAKPSGLRMPSPSMRFFDQAQSSASQASSQISSQCNLPRSDISDKRHIGSLNLANERSPAPGKVARVVNVEATAGTVDVSGSKIEYATQFTCSQTSSGRMECYSNNNMALKERGQSTPTSYTTSNDQHLSHAIQDIADQQSQGRTENFIYERTPSLKYTQEHINDNRFLAHCDQEERNDDGMGISITETENLLSAPHTSLLMQRKISNSTHGQLIKGKQDCSLTETHGIFSQFQVVNYNAYGSSNSDDSSVYVAIDQCQEQYKAVTPSSSEQDNVVIGKDNMSEIEECITQVDSSTDIEDFKLRVPQVHSVSESEFSNGEQAKESSSSVGYSDMIMCELDGQVQSLDASPLLIHDSNMDNKYLIVFDDSAVKLGKADLLDASNEVQQAENKNHGPYVCDAKGFSSEELQPNYIYQNQLEVPVCTSATTITNECVDNASSESTYERYGLEIKHEMQINDGSVTQVSEQKVVRDKRDSPVKTFISISDKQPEEDTAYIHNCSEADVDCLQDNNMNNKDLIVFDDSAVKLGKPDLLDASTEAQQAVNKNYGSYVCDAKGLSSEEFQPNCMYQNQLDEPVCTSAMRITNDCVDTSALESTYERYGLEISHEMQINDCSVTQVPEQKMVGDKCDSPVKTFLSISDKQPEEDTPYFHQGCSEADVKDLVVFDDSAAKLDKPDPLDASNEVQEVVNKNHGPYVCDAKGFSSKELQLNYIYQNQLEEPVCTSATRITIDSVKNAASESIYDERYGPEIMHEMQINDGLVTQVSEQKVVGDRCDPPVKTFFAVSDKQPEEDTAYIHNCSEAEAGSLQDDNMNNKDLIVFDDSAVKLGKPDLLDASTELQQAVNENYGSNVCDVEGLPSEEFQPDYIYQNQLEEHICTSATRITNDCVKKAASESTYERYGLEIGHEMQINDGSVTQVSEQKVVGDECDSPVKTFFAISDKQPEEDTAYFHHGCSEADVDSIGVEYTITKQSSEVATLMESGSLEVDRTACVETQSPYVSNGLLYEDILFYEEPLKVDIADYPNSSPEVKHSSERGTRSQIDGPKAEMLQESGCVMSTSEDGTMTLGIGLPELDTLGDSFPEVSEAKVSQTGSGEIEVESGVMSTSEDRTITLDDKKPDAPVIKLPPCAVPFSDEWLAAVEAAGEEILTLKTGAVQNSPTEKSLHEPGPWSPVRRKDNQGIGPFDCTKHTANFSVHPTSD